MATQSVSAGVSAPAVEWRDGKRYAWLLGAIVPLLPLAAFGLAEWTNWSPFYWFGPLIVFVVIPLIDLIMGTDPNSPPDEAIEALENDRYYRFVIYAYIPGQILTFFVTFWLAAQPGHSLLDQIGMMVTLAMVAGIAINAAHELGHKKQEHERWFARVALAQTFYGHFYIEHNRGHHVRVATPEDPASSKLGENFYQFLPRTVWGSLKSAWRLEKERIERYNRNVARTGQGKPMRFLSLSNDLFNAWIMSVVLWGSVYVLWGDDIGYLRTTVLLLIQGILGFGLLEMVNYLEHYGLLRQKTESGRFERVRPAHSWNSNNIGTNVFLYHLQRHSDHHANPTRRYQALRDFKEAPVLPTGYAGMIVLTWLPPVWRWVMDKRVHAHYDGDISQANILPRKREKYLRKYPLPAQAEPSA